MSWDFAPAFDAAHRAVLESGKPLIYVCAPAAWPVAYLFDALPAARSRGLDTLVLVPTVEDAVDLASALHRSRAHRHVHPLTGLARTEHLLQTESIGTLAATPPDAHYLLRRSALKSDGLNRIAVLWPETILAAGPADDLTALLGDAPDAQRLLITTDQESSASFLERYARRAPVAVHSHIPRSGTGPVRYVAVEPHARVPAARAALDILAPRKALVWEPTHPERWQELATYDDVAMATGPDAEPADLLIAGDLPSADALAAFGNLAAEVLVLLRAHQIAYLERIATAKPLRLQGHSDRVRTEAATLRDGLRKRLEGGDLTAGLLALEPLLEEYDPALVAAAALSAARTVPGASPESPPPPAPPAPLPIDSATWTRLFITTGRRDRVRAGDILKAIMHAASIGRSDVGRIDLKENFSLVEVRPDVAHHVIRCLSGEQIQGRRVTARLDRHESVGGDRD